LYYLEFRRHAIDDDAQEEYADRGLIAPESELHRLDYRLRNDEGDAVQDFRLWTELPDTSPPARFPAVAPIAFEFKARAFLQLKAERVLDPESLTSRPPQ